MSVLLILGFNLDFRSCDILVGFVNPVTYTIIYYYCTYLCTIIVFIFITLAFIVS